MQRATMMFVSAAMAIASVTPPMRHMVPVSWMIASFYTYINIKRERGIHVCFSRPKRDSAHDGEWTIEGKHRHAETEGGRLTYSN